MRGSKVCVGKDFLDSLMAANGTSHASIPPRRKAVDLAKALFRHANPRVREEGTGQYRHHVPVPQTWPNGSSIPGRHPWRCSVLYFMYLESIGRCQLPEHRILMLGQSYQVAWMKS